MMDPATWFFFGVVCMANAPQDCQRIVFDHPMEVTDLGKFKPRTLTAPASIPLTAPLIFKTWDECVHALPAEFDTQKPFAVEGSQWVETGCMRKE
jgi:hypothetical protein